MVRGEIDSCAVAKLLVKIGCWEVDEILSSTLDKKSDMPESSEPSILPHLTNGTHYFLNVVIR